MGGEKYAMRDEEEEILQYFHLSVLPHSNTLSFIYVHFITNNTAQ